MPKVTINMSRISVCHLPQAWSWNFPFSIRTLFSMGFLALRSLHWRLKDACCAAWLEQSLWCVLVKILDKDSTTAPFSIGCLYRSSFWDAWLKYYMDRGSFKITAPDCFQCGNAQTSTQQSKRNIWQAVFFFKYIPLIIFFGVYLSASLLSFAISPYPLKISFMYY